MTEIPAAVREQALHPFRHLQQPKNIQQFELDNAVMSINPHPEAQLAWPTSADVDVAAVVEAARAIAREHRKATIGWWIAPEHDRLVPAFEQLGIVNQETPGFEATENAMALVAPPAGERPTGVDVRRLETFDDYRALSGVLVECFGYTPQPEAVIRERYEEYIADDAGESFIAEIDGKVVGSAFAAFGDVGLNLFGGAVVPDARGRGVYRALVFTRWDVAVECGTPALTVQAGKMSMPILESLGFELVDRARMFVDELV